MRVIYFLILSAGIGNAVLRPAIENPYTLYRMLAPLGLLVILTVNPRLTLKFAAGFVVFVVYGFLLASLYSSDYSQFIPSIVHYLYIFILLVMTVHLHRHDGGFDEAFLRFVNWFYAFLLLNLLVEFMIGSYYPNLYEDESGDGALRAFFWNQNDLAVVLCMFAWLTLSLDRYRGMPRLLVTIITAGLLFLNDSKAALLSFVLISIPVFWLFRVVQKSSIPSSVWLVAAFLGAGVAIWSVVAFSDVELSFASETYSIGALLVDPLMSVVQMSPSGEDLGSINNRTDAAIFVIIEYIRSYGFGLGAGGAWLVLAQPDYKLGGAESPHNALLQFTVDFGYPVLLGYLYAIGWALRKLFAGRSSPDIRLKVIAILSFPVLGLSQSGAIVTNYFFWAMVFFIWTFGRTPPRSAPEHARTDLATRASPDSGLESASLREVPHQ